MEAKELKALTTVSGIHTKVVALGIGSRVDQAELSIIASAPADKNVILVQHFSSLTSVRGQIRKAIYVYSG